MPRLIPKKDAQLVVAVEDVPDLSPTSQRTGLLVHRGQVLRGDDSRVKRHPSRFEPAPTDVRLGPEPRPDECAAVAQVMFTVDGKMIFPGRGFYAYDQVVRWKEQRD